MFRKLIKLSPILNFKASGNSMSPALKPGQNVLVNRLSYLFSQPKIGDVVALKDPRDKKILIKRVAKIEDSKFYVLGDNKKESTDSRSFGWIGKKDIIGKIIFPK